MRYAVRLFGSRNIRHHFGAKVTVEAADEEEAEQLAMQMAVEQDLDWQEQPPDYMDAGEYAEQLLRQSQPDTATIEIEIEEADDASA